MHPIGLENMKTVSSTYLLSFFETCKAQGASEQELLAFIPEGQQALHKPGKRFSTEYIIKILSHTQRATNTPEIGLLAGKDFRPSTFEDVGHALLFCQTLRHVLLVNRRYQPLTQQFGRSNLEIKNGQAWIIWDAGATNPEYYRNVTDAVMAGYAQFGRWLSWVHDEKINAMHFRHKKPVYAALYEDLFECPILFSQASNAMIVDAKIIDMPLPQANDPMLREICTRLDVLLLNLETPCTYQERVGQYIRTVLAQTTPSLADTATRLGLSERSLRRKLHQENTSFRKILEHTRRDLCEQYMAENKLSFTKISEHLGYSEQSAFNRAFKAWHGQTPKAYARALNVFDKAFDQLAP
ncbi:MAG: hypothetical protein COA69_11430 [Robiginitomaculum sp.]|nr:MAG: hypothetical protein COA69_11430 [Robiginitomaculum sp.]